MDKERGNKSENAQSFFQSLLSLFFLVGPPLHPLLIHLIRYAFHYYSTLYLPTELTHECTMYSNGSLCRFR